jgi:hypothetical protein
MSGRGTGFKTVTHVCFRSEADIAGRHSAMSVLPSKADIGQHDCDVRFVPKNRISPPHSVITSLGRAIVARSFLQLLDVRWC